MQKRAKSFALAVASAVGMLGLAPFMPAAAASVPCAVTHVIGVDNLSPAGHNYEYTDFFPRGLPTGTGVEAGFGDCIDFKFAHQADADTGFHTATLLKTTENPTASVSPTNPWQDTPAFVSDAETGEPNQQQNPKVINASDPTCGTAANPCSYDGTGRVNSGAPVQGPFNGTGDFIVKNNSQASQTVYFVCLIHPGMMGSLDIGDVTRTTPPENTNGTGAQYTADTNAAAAAEAAATGSVTTNSDGTKTYLVHAGTAAPHVEVAEMLPKVVNVTAGDKVKWDTRTINDIHTVTFPSGSGSASLDPVAQPLQCEGSPDGATSGGPPTFGCSGGNDATTGSPVEIPFIPGPSGPTAITSTATLATSGVFANPPAPFPSNYTFSFPNAGTFAYQCRIHDYMTGQVLAASVPALPKAGVVPSGLSHGPAAPASPGGLFLVILGAFTLGALVLRRAVR